jgi:hypothetical protein
MDINVLNGRKQTLDLGKDVSDGLNKKLSCFLIAKIVLYYGSKNCLIFMPIKIERLAAYKSQQTKWQKRNGIGAK